MNIKFTKSELDMIAFNKSLDKEVIKISSSEKASQHYATKRTRSPEEIRATLYDSKLCEEFLVQKYNYTYSDKKWHDVINNQGELVEVKFLKSSVTLDAVPAYVKGIYKKIKRYNTSRYIFAFQKFTDTETVYKLVHILDTQFKG